MFLVRNKIFFPFILFLLVGVNLFSQTTPVSYTILGIDVEGNKFADKSTIIALTGLREGDQLTIPGDAHEKIRAAVKTLWLRKQFSDVKIEIEKTTPMGVFLLIRLKENPHLKEINVVNNEELTQEEIVKEIGKNEGDILSNYDVYLAKQKLKKLYKKEGLIFAKVDAELVETDTNYSKLVVDVDEGVHFYVESVLFEGNREFDNDEL